MERRSICVGIKRMGTVITEAGVGLLRRVRVGLAKAG
jgi:hypothetical protein